MSTINFIKALAKDYRVAAISRSSKFTAKKIAKEIEPQYKVVIEYGPGDGIVTKELLKVLPSDGQLIVIELNPDFIKELKKINDHRLKIISGDVVKISKKLKGFRQVDMIISSIPFTFFNPKTREEIINNSYNFLCPGGKILIYQYSLLMLPYLKKICGKKNTHWYIEPLNIPPLWIMIGEKNSVWKMNKK